MNLVPLFVAYKLARRGKRARREVTFFERKIIVNLQKISLWLKNKTYSIKKGEYRIFEIFEPKVRVIMALGFMHRVVAHVLCISMRPEIEKHLATANLANRNDKGTYYGVKMVKRSLRDMCTKHGRDFYALKLDISGFFYNIDRQILTRKLHKIFKDEDERWLMEVIIDSSPDIINPKTKVRTIGKGLPIGNLTSQFWAIFYLNELDHYIKRVLKIKRYLRYMDDLVLFHHDKKYLRYCWRQIEEFLRKRTALELNHKTQIIPIKLGIDFLGFHFYLDEKGKIYLKLRTGFKKRTHKQMKKLRFYFEKAIKEGKMEKAAAIWMSAKDSITSRLGHAKHANAYAWREKVAKEYGYIKQGKGKRRNKAVKLFGCWDYELNVYNEQSSEKNRVR